MKKASLLLVALLLCGPLALAAAPPPDPELQEAERLTREAIEGFNRTKDAEQALTAAREALRLREKVRGAEHPEVAPAIEVIAWLHDRADRYAEAERLYRQALAIREKTQPPESPELARSLLNLGRFYRAWRRYGASLPYLERALALYESRGEGAVAALAARDLARSCDQTGDTGRAGRLFRQALALRQQALGPEHPETLQSLGELGIFLFHQLDFAQAEPLLKQAAEVRERKAGKHGEALAVDLMNLGLLYQYAGRYEEAEGLYRRALAIREVRPGKEHPLTASTLNLLASILYRTGRYTEAESLYLRALGIATRAKGQEVLIAALQDHLGLLYEAVGRVAEAETLYRKALEARERALGKAHYETAAALDHLAALYAATGRAGEARPLLLQAAGLFVQALGKRQDNPPRLLELFTANRIHLIALHLQEGRLAEADRLQRDALAVYVEHLGREHPQVALLEQQLAEICVLMGRYDEAGPLYESALRLKERQLGKGHAEVAALLVGLARVNALRGRHRESHRLFTRAMAIHEAVREASFLLLTEKQKLQYVQDRERDMADYLTHAGRHLAGDAGAVREAFDAWIRWKGAVTETQSRYLEAVLYAGILHYGGGHDLQKPFSELVATRREMARLQFSRAPAPGPQERAQKLLELERRKDALEATLNRLSQEFSLEGLGSQRVDTLHLARLLRPDSVYIDFLKLRPRDFQTGAPAEPGYHAFVLLPGSPPQVRLLDLGPAATLDGHVAAYLQEMNQVKTGARMPALRVLQREAGAIFARTLRPLLPLLEGKRTLLVSPDGNLNLIPFGVLTPDGKRYLVEDYEIAYIAAGRDILRFADVSEARGESVIIADPHYDLGAREREKAAGTLAYRGLRFGGHPSRDALDLHFGPLPETKQEADAIEGILRERMKIAVRNVQGAEAVEEVLYRAEHPRLLHLATHGYFLGAQGAPERGLRGVTLAAKASPADPRDGALENPMLRSGIALAGVNPSLREGRDEGLLSAEKILGLKLKGTDLVVLSACETGVGTVQSGEGVFGLKRAFILSGAKTLVMSLWSVPSRETTALMTDFYGLMAQGRTKSQALREAHLRMLRKEGHPFYWGAFILVGNPQ